MAPYSNFIKKRFRNPEWKRTAVLSFFLGCFFFSQGIAAEAEQENQGWGINARLSFLPPLELDRRAVLLERAGVTWTREDFRAAKDEEEPGKRWVQEETFQRLRTKNFKVLALVPYGVGQKPAAPENFLHEDLLFVFNKAREWSTSTGNVDAWENFNEADVGFCRDLPDRSTAYMKAVYLGLKAGRADRPVLMGALALPPGPWLRRAAENGLFQYADGYNFHYYGYPEDFAAVFKAHRNFLSRYAALQRFKRGYASGLPVWITECGFNAPAADPLGREEQATFFSRVAMESQKAGAASLMPFSLTFRKHGGLGLLQENLQPYPAWDAFGSFAENHSLAGNFSAGNAGDTLVLQWMPDAGAAIPHKVSGTYRFRETAQGNRLPIKGEIRFYNFGEKPRAVDWKISGLRQVKWQGPVGNRIEIKAGEQKSISVVFTPPQEGYSSEKCSLRLKEDEREGPVVLSFGLEIDPRSTDFQKSGLNWLPLNSVEKTFHWIDGLNCVESGRAEPWLGANGMVPLPGTNGASCHFQIEDAVVGRTPMAIAGIRGLPFTGFLRLRADRPFDTDFSVRVDLVDSRGQRFTVFENQGMSYFKKTNELWLNLKDFHLYFWGHCENPIFNPSLVREVQLRPTLKWRGTPVLLDLDLMVPRPMDRS